MPAPPPKKRRVILEISDDDEYEEQSVLTPTSSAPALRRTRSSTRRAVDLSLPTPSSASSEKPEPPPSKLKAASKSRTNSLKKSQVSPPSKKKPPAGNKSIYTFFAASQRAPASQRASPPTAPSQPAPASQHEDLEDLIEDGFSDDSGSYESSARGRPEATRNNNGSQNTSNGRPGIGRGRLDPRSLAFLGSATTKVRRVDSRPWPERFAPRTLSSLAVNPRKVAEVRAWFEHVFDGFSKKRLLVLRGSAGTGKTAVIQVLSRELGFEILEWKNPSGAVQTENYNEETCFSAGLAGIFEEFVGRAGRFASLDMVSTAQASIVSLEQTSTRQGGTPSDAGDAKKIILIEDFPNALFTSSPVPLASFRHTIKSFLALPSPPRFSAPLPPLVLIISESAHITGPSAFTAHRLLSPEVTHHPLATSITFNKIAPTFMIRALSAVVTQESRESGRKFVPSKAMLEALSTSGDVRSAVIGLEFLALNGDLGAFSENVSSNEKSKKKRKSLLGESELNQFEREMLQTVTQRESSLGFFHAVGRVVYNKRYGDDAEDPYAAPPPTPPLDTHPYRKRASRVDFESLMDEAGTDPQTFISGLHENYLGSCNLLGGLSRGGHSLEDSLACAIACIEHLSDSDLLSRSSSQPHHTNYSDDTSASIKLDEISFQTAARGVALGLPTPVKRAPKDNKMFYPTSLRLWRQTEENQGLVDLLSRKVEITDGVGKTGLVTDNMPYLKIISRARQRDGSMLLSDLEKVTGFSGIGAQSEEVPGEDSALELMDELEVAENGRGRPSGRDNRAERELAKPSMAATTITAEGELGMVRGVVENLVLSDDDIEDDW